MALRFEAHIDHVPTGSPYLGDVLLARTNLSHLLHRHRDEGGPRASTKLALHDVDSSYGRYLLHSTLLADFTGSDQPGAHQQG